MTRNVDETQVSSTLEKHLSPDDDSDSPEAEGDNRKSVPIDRGWAWLVLVGSVIVMCIIIGSMKASGILFVTFQSRYHANSALTSLLSTVQNAVQSVSALFVMTVGVTLTSYRVFVFIGGVLICVSYVITAMAEDIIWLLLSYGVLLGIASACVIPTTVTMIGQYFNKKRGLANSLAVSGGSVGGLIFAPLITVLLETYGYRGCMWILAGIHLHICISALIFRPTSFFTKKAKMKSLKHNTLKKEQREKLQSDFDRNKHVADIRKSLLVRRALTGSLSTGINDVPDDSVDYVERKPRSSSVSVKVGHHTVEVESLLLGSVPCIPDAVHTSPFTRPRTHTESSIHRVMQSFTHSHKNHKRYHSSEYLGGSHVELSGLITTPKSKKSNIVHNADNQDEVKTKVEHMRTLKKIFDLSLLTNPVFFLMALSFMLLCPGNLMCMVYMAPHATDVGISPHGVAAIVTIYSAVDLCARILLGILADLRWFRCSTIVGTCALISGISCSFLSLYTTFALLVAFSVVLGIVSGAYFALSAVIIVDYLSVERLHSVLGYTTLSNGASVAAGYYAMGLLRDTTGSYVASFRLSATMNLVGGALLCILPLIEKWQTRKMRRSQNNSRGFDVYVEHS